MISSKIYYVLTALHLGIKLVPESLFHHSRFLLNCSENDLAFPTFNALTCHTRKLVHLVHIYHSILQWLFAIPPIQSTSIKL